MNINNILYTILVLTMFGLLIFSSVKQYQNLKDYKTLFISIAIVSILAISIEINNVFKTEKTDTFTPCEEMNRVCWRRSILLSFIILLLLNYFYIQNNNSKSHNFEEINILIFFFIFFIIYFYLNWDQYHRAGTVC